MKDKDPNRFYVYTHAKPNGTVFYVGKGCGNRATSKANRNRFHEHVTSKYGWENIIVSVVASGVSEEEAFRIEIDTIRAYKSKGAPLVNMSEGGEGPSGMVHSAASLAKMSNSQKKAWDVPGRKEWASETFKALASLPHVRASKSLHGKKMFSNSSFKEAWVDSIKTRNSDPEFQAKAREGLMRKFSDDEFAKAHTARVREMWADEEFRKARVTRMTEVANSPAAKERNRGLIARINGSPEHRARQRKASREVSQRPEIKAARAAQMRAVCADPVLRAKRSAASKAYYSSPRAKWDSAMQVANRFRIPYSMLNKNVFLWIRKLSKKSELCDVTN